jgi:hypothetical protein
VVGAADPAPKRLKPGADVVVVAPIIPLSAPNNPVGAPVLGTPNIPPPTGLLINPAAGGVEGATVFVNGWVG